LVATGGVKEETARQLFARGNVVVGRNVSAGQADLIASRLRAAGVVVDIEPAAVTSPVARATPTPPRLTALQVDSPTHRQPAHDAPRVAAPEMQCPKCGARQTEAASCIRCGVIVEKYLALKAEADAALEPLAAPRPAPGLPLGVTGAASDVTVLTPAPRGVRLAARTVDRLLIVLCFVAIVAPSVAWASKLRFVLGGGLAALATLFCVQTVMLAVRGQTVGKMALGVRVVRATDGSNPGFLRAVLMRSWLSSLLGSVFGVYELVDAAFILRKDRRCVHDLIADTIVVDAGDADAQILRLIAGTRARQALLIVALVGVGIAAVVKTSSAFVDVLPLQAQTADTLLDGMAATDDDAGEAGGGGPDLADLFSGLLLLAILGATVIAIRRLRD
jgi:uncharacterized RDD family membrane protein YckC